MKKNMGSSDRLIRLLVALTIGVLVYSGVIAGGIATALLALAGILVITSLVGFCPLYAPFGVHTCRK